MGIKSSYNRFKTILLPVIIKDLEGYIEYRNYIYNLNCEFPKTVSMQKKLICQYFRGNINGFRDMV